MEAVLHNRKVTRNQRKQVSRFFERVMPFRKVPSILQRALGNTIAVGKKDGGEAFVGDDARAELSHHIGPVEIVCDPAKPLCLTLRTEDAVGLIKAGEGCVGGGRTYCQGGQNKFVGNGRDGERGIVHLIAIFTKPLIIKANFLQLKVLAVQHKRFVTGSIRVPSHMQD